MKPSDEKKPTTRARKSVLADGMRKELAALEKTLRASLKAKGKRPEVGGAGAETEARVLEMVERYRRLLMWGSREKLKFTAGTHADLDAFFIKWGKGERDETKITAMTSGIRSLEKYAAEHDAAAKVAAPFVDKGPLRTGFDIEGATAPLEVAAVVVHAADNAKAFAGDAAKDAFAAAKNAAVVVPPWAWGLGALVVGYLVLDKIAKAASAIDAIQGRGGQVSTKNRLEDWKGLLGK